jgi:hypothetical protein
MHVRPQLDDAEYSAARVSSSVVAIQLVPFEAGVTLIGVAS